jgi:hypothetical protein
MRTPAWAARGDSAATIPLRETTIDRICERSCASTSPQENKIATNNATLAFFNQLGTVHFPSPSFERSGSIKIIVPFKSRGLYRDFPHGRKPTPSRSPAN